MGKINKLTLPATILIASIILGGFFYASQVNKQKFSERQQLIKLQDEKRIEESKAEQAKKEYAADRRNDCLSVYKTESDIWNNVRGWRYSETDEKCFIRYKDTSPKSDSECDENYPTSGDYGYIFFHQNSLCKDGEFENVF